MANLFTQPSMGGSGFPDEGPDAGGYAGPSASPLSPSYGGSAAEPSFWQKVGTMVGNKAMQPTQSVSAPASDPNASAASNAHSTLAPIMSGAAKSGGY